MFQSDLTSNLHNKLNPLKIAETQATQLKQGNERAEVPKQRPKNEKNIFADQTVTKRIEDDHTFKPKVIPRAEKFAPRKPADSEPALKSAKVGLVTVSIAKNSPPFTIEHQGLCSRCSATDSKDRVQENRSPFFRGHEKAIGASFYANPVETTFG